MQSRQRAWVVGAVSLLLLLMATEIAMSVRGQSLTWDEGDHLFAGYMSIKTHDYSLNPEHPPMAKMVAALPLLPLELKVPPSQGRYFKDEAYFRGRELLFRNGPATGGRYGVDTLIFRARMSIMVFVITLALLVFLAGREMFGLGAGFIALILVVFDPSLLTNGAYITTDATVSCMFFATVYAFYRYVKAPSPTRLILTGVLAGMAAAAKHSAILLLPIFALLVVGELAIRWWQARSANATGRSLLKQSIRLAGALAVILAIGTTVLWAFYGFRYNMRPAGAAMSPSLASTAATLKPFQAKTILFFAHWHLLPESYLFGMVNVRQVADWMPSYIFGKLHAHGVWFYFPVVLAVKFTLGAALLLALSVWAVASGRLKRPREVWFLLVPPAVYLAVAMASPLNIGVRHILPTFAFMLTLAAGGAWTLAKRSRRWAYVVGALLLWHAISSARVFPNYMPYSNELWGGPTKTHLYLSDSATDWGQQLKAVKVYVDQHQIKECWFAYFVAPFVLPADYGIPCKLLPTVDTQGEMDIDLPATIHGPIFISYADLNGFEFGTKIRNPYQALFERQPDAVIMNGVAVYNGEFSLPLAASIAPIERAKRLLDKKDLRGALREANAATTLDGGSLDAQLVLGDVLRALNREPEATEHYNQAMQIVSTMEPSAQKEWSPTVRKRLARQP